ncbi:hypothetical protein B0T22DRAFT_438694 [Podospora appendiculata]|uniref:Uncharacterized protein n=1 Tax=Podospora appendiculata TaxID=314037 RepID=A0AAE1CIB7_9PEZI|nr:hypothetical protein B0T22DRAFT_438694 [Podospora appendiculata]
MSFVSIPSILQQSPTSTRPNSRRDSRVIGIAGHDGFSSTIELLERNQLPKLPTPDYKPLPLRWPFLASLFVFLLGLAGLAEYVARAFPPGLSHEQGPEHDTWRHGGEKDVSGVNMTSFPSNVERPRKQLDLPTPTISNTDNFAQAIAITPVMREPHPPTGSYFQAPTTFYPAWETIANTKDDPYDTWELEPNDPSRGRCLYIRLQVVWMSDPTLSIGNCLMIYTPSSDPYPGSFGGETGQVLNTCDNSQLAALDASAWSGWVNCTTDWWRVYGLLSLISYLPVRDRGERDDGYQLYLNGSVSTSLGVAQQLHQRHCDKELS